MAGDRVTRVAADLLDSAAVEGARQSRSAKQQLDHWARVGRCLSAQQTVGRLRIEAALRGSLPMRDLSPEERLVANAEIDTGIEERVRSLDFGAVLAAEGVSTVTLDEQGRLVRHHPDGTSSLLG